MSGSPSESPFSLDGRRALVTGAARGIGFAVAHRLLQAGCDVVVNDVDVAALDRATDQLSAAHGGAGRRVVPALADVGDRSTAPALIDAAMSGLGGLDVLVNNAGFYAPTPLDDLDDAVVDRLFAVNVKGLLSLSVAAAAVMGPGSTIIHLSSLGGVRPPFPGLAAYHATKGAVDSLTRDMALSWGPKGIRVNSAAPGGILTEGQDQVTGSSAYSAEEMEAIVARCTARPLGRMGNADDIATVVVFLASPAARFITGQMVLVDGGMYFA